MAKTPAHHNKKGEKLEAFGKTCQILFFFPLFSFFVEPLVFYAGNMEAGRRAFTFPSTARATMECPTSTCSPPPTLCPFPGFSPFATEEITSCSHLEQAKQIYFLSGNEG